VCDDGYSNKDCSVNLRDPPIVKGVVGDGVCKKGNKTCNDIRITTDGCVQTATCKIERTMVSQTMSMYGDICYRLTFISNGFCLHAKATESQSATWRFQSYIYVYISK